jgi:hypothetical protein
VPYFSEEEILSRIKRTVGFWRVQKWLAILIATVDPCPAQEIARHTGLAEQTIHNLISSYNRLGPQVLEGPGKGNRVRAYLSLEEEAGFLKPFFERAATGRIATAREILKALEKRLGCSLISLRLSTAQAAGMAQNSASTRPWGGENGKPGGIQKKFPEIASKHLESKDPEDSRPVVIMAQDEGRFDRISNPRRAVGPHSGFAQKHLNRSSENICTLTQLCAPHWEK